MKNKIFPGAIILLLFAVITLAALAQKSKENKGGHNKEQGNNGKGHGNNNKGNDKSGDKGNGHGNKEDHGNNKGNKEDHGDNDKQGNDDRGNGKDKHEGKMEDGYRWDRETFKDRSSIRKNMNKVTICHKPGRNNEHGVTLSVSENALKAHMNHGDVTGSCPTSNTPVYSDIFIKRRTEYYTTLQDGQEQVLYSRSILDYALERLTGARSQLVLLQQTNAPAADIERKKLVVVDLEQNVSLLQTLIGVAANLIVTKLMN